MKFTDLCILLFLVFVFSSALYVHFYLENKKIDANRYAIEKITDVARDYVRICK